MSNDIKSQKQDVKGNCAQQVILAYSKQLGLDEDMLIKLTDGLGGGMGNTKGTCGAIAGGACLMGLVFSEKTMENQTAPSKSRAYAKQIMDEFEKKNGSTICRDIKGLDTGVVLRSCPDCIQDVMDIIDDIFANH